jgi:hypothetical protein
MASSEPFRDREGGVGSDVVMEEEEGVWWTEAVLMMMASIQLQLRMSPCRCSCEASDRIQMAY